MVKTEAISVKPYADRLKDQPDWALWEGGMHFEEKNSVHQTLQKITRRLSDLKIPYAVAGGMALFLHDYRRFTEDVDLIVTPEGLKATHDALEGLGWVRAFAGSKRLRDAETGVQVDFLITGQFPGDGKPKPVAFPEPSSVAVEINGIQVIALPKLVELKLASGMTVSGRRKDLADVQEVIRFLKLEREFQLKLDPYVRDQFLQLWDELKSGPDIES